jgi:ABC-type phosphate/phosphonate transport system substrate-binding protein
VKSALRTRLRIGGIVVAAAMLSLAIACTGEDKVQSVTPDNTKATLAQASSRIGLVFPPASQLIGISDESGIDTLVRLKISTDEAGLAEFLRANAIDRAGFEEAQRVLLLPDAAWWDPSKAQSLPTIQIRKPGGPTLNIGYAATAGGRVELYVAWFTT